MPTTPKEPRGETMNRLSSLALCAVWVALIFSFATNRAQAQAAPPAAPSPEQAQKPANPPSDKDAKKAEGEGQDPFAPEPAPALPPGMSGSDVNDPRFK